MSETKADNFTIEIDNMLKKSKSFAPSKPSIFRVGDQLRNRNPEAYDPEIIAIGPFHHNKPQLRNMEQHKVRYLKLLLQTQGESSVERYVTAITELEDRARNCYAEEIQLDQGTFVKMLLLDGCFIIEFLHKFHNTECRDEDDPIFQYGHIQSHLLNDLMVFENQIPFFIIDCLFNMIYQDDIDSLIWPLLQNGIFPVQHLPEVPEGHHLLGIVHDIQCSSFANMLSPIDSENDVDNIMENINSAIELKEAGISFKKLEVRDDEENINSGIDFKEAGISFKKSEVMDYVMNMDSEIELKEAGNSFKNSEGKSLFHIEFNKKTMTIPVWEISDATESLFRNLIAYEYYLTGSHKKYVTDYVFFMHCLVHSPEDAKLLRRCGVISNFLGGDEMVYRVINQLGKNIIISDKFSYSNIFHNVNRHCRHRRNRWMAKLRRDYFNSPWALVSVLAASALLLLAIVQTTFAILSYRNDLRKDN